MKEIRTFVVPVQVVLLFILSALFTTIIASVFGAMCALLSASSFADIMYSDLMHVFEGFTYFFMLFIVGEFLWGNHKNNQL